jgi:DNA-binding transcriptional regulator PaaX
VELTFKDTYMDEEFKVIVPLKDMLAITHTLNESASLLYWYLHSKGMRWKWSNKNIANDLGWKESKVRDYKLKLKQSGWIDYWSNKGNKYMYLGKDKVAQCKIDKLDAKRT